MAGKRDKKQKKKRRIQKSNYMHLKTKDIQHCDIFASKVVSRFDLKDENIFKAICLLGFTVKKFSVNKIISKTNVCHKIKSTCISGKHVVG